MPRNSLPPRASACACLHAHLRPPQALLHYFEARIPRLFLAVYVLVERLPCLDLGQDHLPEPAQPLRTLPSLAKYFRTTPGQSSPSGRAFTFD